MRILAIDIGSSSTRTGLFDERGRQHKGTRASREYAVQYGGDGGAVLDPRKLYRAVRDCVRETLARDDAEISAISASAFWHGLLGLDREGDPATPIYMWGDGRAAEDARRLREEIDEHAVHERTGCMLRTSFWPAKLRWIHRTDPTLFRRAKMWVSPADWVLARLFGATGTSVSMASATGLFNLAANTWDEELCALSNVKPESLGSISSQTRSSRHGTIFNAIGDGAASNIGSGADHRGAFAINVGTSAAVRTVCARVRSSAPFGLFRYLLDEERAIIGGAISNAGNLRRWCLRELHIDAEETSRLTPADRRAAATNKLDVLPFWVAERAPTWPENIHGTISGFSQATTALDIERAAQCSVFYRLAQIFDLTESASGPAKEVVVSGGILRAPSLIQLLADAIGRDVMMAKEKEASLSGAAVYALEKLGCTADKLPRGRVIKHGRELARLHRERQARQQALERTFSSPA